MDDWGWVEEELAKGTSHGIIVQIFRERLYYRVLLDLGWNKSQAARKLKMSRNNLDHWLKKATHACKNLYGNRQYLYSRPRKNVVGKGRKPEKSRRVSTPRLPRLVA